MAVSVSAKSARTLKTDLLVLVIGKDGDLFEGAPPSIERTLKEVRAGLKARRIRKEFVLGAPAGVAARYVMIAAMDLVRFLPEEECLRTIGGRAVRTAKEMNLGSVGFVVGGRGAKEGDVARRAGLLVEGALLGSYGFEKYRQRKSRSSASLEVVVAEGFKKAVKAEVDRVAHQSAAVNRCRDMVNEPGGVVYPEVMAASAEAIAKRAGLECEIWDEKRLAADGFNGLLQVGAGSGNRPPRLIVLRYRPEGHSGNGNAKGKGKAPHLALVGKGLTFDTGGISIKPADKMWMMKGDMAGGAACLHAMEVVAALRPAMAVTAIVPSSENYPGPGAQLPGDIFVARNGKSIHVDNTDAEGRLILTDGLFQAGVEGATHILDIATLTGSCARALGTSIAGIMGTDAPLIHGVIAEGRRQGENFWELPLHEEYREMIEVPMADVNNVGGPYAGAITAGLFLREFVPQGAAWAHLDVAGVFITEKGWKHYGPGATGFGVKTLAAMPGLIAAS